MTSNEVRQKYLKFFEERGHKIIPSASLVPENDPTTLFVSSGMQPLIPYLLGQKHPVGNRLVNSQRSLRAFDILEVGDNRHTTFFEMLGNWSLGEYFKKEQLPWIFEFLIGEVGLDPSKLFITVYSGDDRHGFPKDQESVQIWKKLFAEKGIEAKDIELTSEENAAGVGTQGGRIFYYRDKNWWSRAGVPDNMPAGEPGGPSSEMFYEFSGVKHDKNFGENCHPNCDCGHFVEIGNSVFMEYQKQVDGSFKKLEQKNVDFGGGLERIVATSIDTPDVFQTDFFIPVITKMETLSGKDYKDKKNAYFMRIIADHLRAVSHLVESGIRSGNTDQGYVLRRFIRRSIFFSDKLGLPEYSLKDLISEVVRPYKDSGFYEDLYGGDLEIIQSEISNEEEKFRETLSKGMKIFEKISNKDISGSDAFMLFSTYGFPVEMTEELAKEKGISVDMEGYQKEFKKHQELSRSGSEQKFRGGLADHKEETVRLHTTHHLLLSALQKVLGSQVKQRGSNITAERLRIDFSFDRKMTDEEKKEVEDRVNSWIDAGLDVVRRDMSKEEAINLGAEMEFGAKYGDMVSVYFIEDKNGTPISKEFCGGPHVKNTSELGKFKIKKEEASSAGVRRIKAVLE